MAQLSVKADQRPLPAGVEVSPASLAMQVKGLGRNAASRTVVLNHTASDVPVQVAPIRRVTSTGPAAPLPPPPTAGCRSS